MNYILVIIATVLLAFDFSFAKMYQMSQGTAFSEGLKFNAAIGLFSAAIFFILSGFNTDFSLYSMLLALGMSACCMLYSIIGLVILKLSNISVYTVFLMCGGMLLPYIFGICFLDEKPTLLRIVGIIIMLVAVFLSNRTKFEFNPTLLLLCLLIFVLNGMVSIISKCHQITTSFETVDSTTFVMYSGICKFILSSIALIFCKKEKGLYFSSKKVILIMVASALIGGVSYMLQLIGATQLPASVLYPICTGGSILFSSLAGVILFKEKLSTYQTASVILCIIGTLLFL